VVLNQTLFYPEGGGQLYDTGWLDGIKVKEVQKREGVIFHIVENPKKLRKGKQVRGKIDFPRRMEIMKHHTATHLLNAATRALLGKHVWQAGALKTKGYAHLDVSHYRHLKEEEIRKLEENVNANIQANLSVSTKVYSRNEAEKRFGFGIYQGGYVPGKEVRIVEIKNADIEACAGTHLKKTGEIGFFKVTKTESVQDGVQRIYFVTGKAALQFVRMQEQLLKEAAQNLAVPVAGLPHATQRFFSEWKNLKKQLEKIQQTKAKTWMEEIQQQSGSHHYVYAEELEPKKAFELVHAVLGKKPEKTVVVGCSGQVIVGVGKKGKGNAKKILKEILRFCGGKGGGNPFIAQGKTKNTERLKEWIEKALKGEENGRNP
jgi:alanyl-tRNA synthetase